MNSANPIGEARSSGGMARPGFTLVEMVAVMGIMAFILVSVAVTISSLQRLNVKLRDDIPASARLSRLAGRFRVDVHSARDVILEKDSQSRTVVRLTVGQDRVVEYFAEQGHVSRVVYGGTQIEHRESFQLARRSQINWSVEGESKSLVNLTIERPVGKISGATDDQQTTTITAAVGWNQGRR